MESMSNLEKTLRYAYGINMVVRKNLLKAYLGDNGMTEVPKILEENVDKIDADVMERLRVLAVNEDAEV